MRLRPYQADALQKIEAAFASGQRSVLAVLATGLGKTVLFSHLAARKPAGVIVLAHRDELIQQAVEKLGIITGEEVGIEMGERYSPAGCRIVASSVQTLSRPNRQRRFDPSRFGLLIIDEAHHAVARTYRAVIDYLREGVSDPDPLRCVDGNPDLRVLGVTATPNRGDSLALGQVFDVVACEYGIEPAVGDGWLVPVRQRAVQVEGLDFSKVRTLAGDFHEGELEKILTEEETLHQVAAPAVELAGNRQALVFCVTVAHARLMAGVIDRYAGEGAAVALDGTTDRQVRADEVKAFREGRRRYLCNCGLFLEGFDAPSTACIVMARPTKSLALYAQILGRGTRPLPGVVDPHPDDPRARRTAIADSKKPDVLIIDFVGNAGRHRIVTALDLLGGKWDEPVRAYARKTLEQEGQPAEVEQSLERAQDELALLEEIHERQRRAAIKARPVYHTREISPFGPSHGPEVEHAGQAAPIEAATEKQVWYLVRRVGWSEAAARRLSKRAASAVIGKHRAEIEIEARIEAREGVA